MTKYTQMRRMTSVLLCCSMLMSCTGGKDGMDINPDPVRYVTFGLPGVMMQGVEMAGGPDTKSVLHNSFPDGGMFRVFGYCIPDMVNGSENDYAAASSPWNTKSQRIKADIFYETDVTCSGAVTSYGNGSLKEWYTAGFNGVPEGAQVSQFRYSFLAHYPVDCFTMNMRNADAVGVPVLSFSMPWSGGDMDTPRDHAEIPDAMLAARFDHIRANGAVPLNFYHIMTGLRFRVNNYSDEDLIIESARLSGQFYSEATFDFTTTKVKQTATALGQKSFSGYFSLIADGTSQTCPSGASSPYLGVSDTNPEGTTVLLLPNLDADPSTADRPDNPIYSLGDKKTITIRYRYAGDADVKTAVIPDFHLSCRPAQSTRYTANLNFVGDRFVLIFQADTDSWGDGSDNGIIIN